MTKNTQKEMRPRNRCGDCKRYDECNEILKGNLNPDETFPESRTGCLSFLRKEKEE